MGTVIRSSWILCSGYGSTGRSVLDQALRRGHRPVLTARDNTHPATPAPSPFPAPIVAIDETLFAKVFTEP